jgi:peptidoglycan hydrolase FlgJ
MKFSGNLSGIDNQSPGRSPLLEGTSEPGEPREERAALKAAQEFEALFLTNLTAALNPSEDSDEEGLFSSGASEMYRRMFSEQIAKTLAQNGGLGLADSVMRQLRKTQRAQESPGLHRIAEIARTVRGSAAESLSASSDSVRPASHRASAEEKPQPHPMSGVLRKESPAVGEEAVELQSPLKGHISSGFGLRRDPIAGNQRRHHGVDISAPRGAGIAAAAAGTVVFAGKRGGYGNLVEIEHADGRRTRYAHAERLLVSPGQYVEDGQLIATVGSTGRSTGPHLHFEVTENGAKIDPLQALAKVSPSERR